MSTYPRNRIVRVAAPFLVIALAVLGLGVGSAGAQEPPPDPEVPPGPELPPGATLIAGGLISPLQAAVTDRGDILVGQAFAGMVSSVSRSGRVSPVHTSPGKMTAGVAQGPFGITFFTESVEEEGIALLRYKDFFGGVHTMANLGRFEERRNPDKINTYGFEDISAECAAELPAEIGPPTYEGTVHSNPYALLVTLFGVVVADAGANAILLVDWAGGVHVLKVLPPQPGVVTAEAAAELGVPDCAVGLTYLSEPVPTDVEMTSSHLMISTLAGGVSAGSVYRLNPFSGSLRQVATGFAGASNLAIGPNGTIYVSELFAGRVSRIVSGAPVPVLEIAEPAALEWSRGGLIIGSGAFGPGSLIRWTP